MAKRANWRKVKSHRAYTVDEASRLLMMSKGTIRRWLKNGLNSVDDRKPALIKGTDLIDYIKGQSQKTRKCAIDECFCFTCREPKRVAFGEVEIIQSFGGKGMMQGLCECCTGLLYKRVSMANIRQVEAILKITIRQAGEPITNSTQPCLNDHFGKE